MGDWDDWDGATNEAPVATMAPPPAVAAPALRGKGRGLLRMKVTSSNPPGSASSKQSFGRINTQSDDWGSGDGFSSSSSGNFNGGGFGGQSSRACRKCNEEGHFARDCPNDRGGFGGGGGGRACHRCNEEGHFARECPNSAGDTRTCRKCNKPGHIARDCPDDDGRGGGGFGGSRTCHKCNEEGHFARECPNSDYGGGGGGSRACHRCNEEGHFARECPNADSRTCRKCNKPGHIARDCPEESSMLTDGPGPSTYVPADYDYEEDLIVKAGINFDNYDRIDVEVTGRNKPTFISSFNDAKLHPKLQANIPREFSKPTPVQKYSIPIIQNDRDLMACSMTGSGKTAAFLLPIIDYLLKEPDPPLLTNPITVFPRALIVAPTRELVLQTYQWSEKFTKGTHIRGKRLYGKLATAFCKSHLREGGGTHILSATPGRLKDFLEKGWVSFNFLRYVVLDEADRMLDMGFAPDIEEIFGRMLSDRERHVSMFSATFPQEVQQLASKYLDDYLFLAVGIVGAACSDVEQQIILVEQPDENGQTVYKDDCLREILMGTLDKSGRMTKKVLVFVEQKKKADCLGIELCDQNFSSTTIHGDREQPEREEALRTFKRGKHMLLVATSVAARGLDIPEVDIVINYDIPSDIDSYVHRIGRTGRCGNKGKAISFYNPSSDSALARFLVDTLKNANQKVPAFLDRDATGMGSSAPFGQSRDIRRNVPRSRHTIGFGTRVEENDYEATDNFMEGGTNHESSDWGVEGANAGADDGW